MSVVHVVAAIIERDGRVLCAHRPSGMAGPGWEFPGGRVEEGETTEQALRREVLEELGVRIALAWHLGTVEHDYPTFHLSMDCFVCGLAPGEEPTSSEHDEIRWVDRDGLLSLEWLPADEGIVRQLGMCWDQTFATSHL